MPLTVHEGSYIDTLLYSRLDGDATLRGLLGGHEMVWADVIPEGQAFPGVVYKLQSGTDVVAIGAVRYVTKPLYLVQAVTTGDSFVLAGQIADRVDFLLMGYKGTQGPISVTGIYREQMVRYHKVEEGVRYNYVGGLYRLFVCSSS